MLCTVHNEYNNVVPDKIQQVHHLGVFNPDLAVGRLCVVPFASNEGRCVT